MSSTCSGKNDRLWWGLVALVVGAVVLLQRFGVVPPQTWDYLWPSFLVVQGIKFIISGDACACNCDESSCKDCGNMACSCDTMPTPKKTTGKKAKRK